MTVEAFRVLLEAMRVIIEAVRKIIEAVRLFVEAVRLLVEAGRVQISQFLSILDFGIILFILSSNLFLPTFIKNNFLFAKVVKMTQTL